MTLLSYFFTFGVMNIDYKFDKEYSTQWMAEKNWLSEHGIQYNFVKTINGISTFKYKKNYTLFKALCSFYENVYTSK